MSAVVKLSVGRAGAAGDNVRYITRERATEGEQERVWTRNVPGYANEGDGYKERTSNLIEYARQLEEDELDKPQRGAGKTRTHYRAIYSFDKEVSDGKARELVDRHLDENFPKARTIAAIHRDTDNAHVHVQIAARQTDGRKVQLSREQYRSLDERWARIYGREFGREITDEHLRKKEEWRAWMRESRERATRGEQPRPRPKRVTHERNQVQERRVMATRQYAEVRKAASRSAERELYRLLKRDGMKVLSDPETAKHLVRAAEKVFSELKINPSWLVLTKKELAQKMGDYVERVRKNPEAFLSKVDPGRGWNPRELGRGSELDRERGSGYSR